MNWIGRRGKLAQRWLENGSRMARVWISNVVLGITLGLCGALQAYAEYEVGAPAPTSDVAFVRFLNVDRAAEQVAFIDEREINIGRLLLGPYRPVLAGERAIRFKTTEVTGNLKPGGRYTIATGRLSAAQSSIFILEDPALATPRLALVKFYNLTKTEARLIATIDVSVKKELMSLGQLSLGVREVRGYDSNFEVATPETRFEVGKLAIEPGQSISIVAVEASDTILGTALVDSQAP